jgi:hypothetical protein
MKILITENKLYRTIYNYIEDTFDISNLEPSHPEVWDDEEMSEIENPYITDFYYDTWGEDEKWVFSYYSYEYYSNEPSSNPLKDKSPILSVNGHDWQNLSSMFGNYWKDPMKKWFEDNYKLPVKTIVAD